jgi:hypothetical protein
MARLLPDVCRGKVLPQQAFMGELSSLVLVLVAEAWTRFPGQE